MKQLLLLLIVVFIGSRVYSFELDTSVDDEIRKNYNPSALEQSLPPLPKTSPNQSKNQSDIVPKNLPVTENVKPVVKKMQENPNFDKSTAIRIKKGTKFKVRSSAYLSDSTQSGARLSFTTLSPVTQRYVTIPAGTQFGAVITNSHSPQVTGNGGLLEIAVDSIKYNGQAYYASGKITKVNHKKVFLNNIKGQRKYWKGVANQVDKGESFYKKTRQVSSRMSNNPISAVVSSVPTIVGTGAYAVNLVTSPITSLGTKGGKISIPAGTEFEIKLIEDVYLQ